MDNPKLKYVLLGNLSQKTEIGEYPQMSSEQYAKEAKQIFGQLCKTNYSRFEERQQIVSTNGNFYFSSTQSGNFFIEAFVDANYSERYVYSLFDSISKEGIFDLMDSSGRLSSEGNKRLKSLFEKNEDLKRVNSIHSANLEIQEVKSTMGKNIQGMLTNINDLNDLDTKAKSIKEGSLLYQKDARELERVTCWQNWKLTIIIVMIVVILFLVIGLPLILR